MKGDKGRRSRAKSELHARLGAELAALRVRKGLSQREFAKLAGLHSDGHVANVENGVSGPSERVLREYVRHCGGVLGPLLILYDQIQVASRESSDDRRPVQDRAGALRAENFYDPPEPERLYVLDSSDLFFTLDERGVGKEVRLSLSIRAKAYGVDRYYTGWVYNGANQAGSVTPLAGFGCRVGEFHDSDLGAVHGHFLLDKKLTPEDLQPYPFSFRMKITANNRAVPPTVGQFKTDTTRHVVHMQFTPPAIPKKVWWFDVSTAVDIETDPEPHQIFPINEDGYYFKEFPLPRGGRFYGFNYQWE